MNLKNIVIVNDFNYIQGGASKVALNTAKLLKNYGYNVYFFSAVFKEDEVIEGINYITSNQKECLKDSNKIRGMLNGLYNKKAKKCFQELLDKLDKNETIIHIHGWTKALSSSVFDIAYKKRFKIVLTLHDYFSACPNGGYFNFRTNKICTLKGNSIKCVCKNCDSRNYLFKIYRVARMFVQNKVVGFNKKLNYAIGISDLNIKVLKDNFKNCKIYKVNNPIDINKTMIIDSRENNDYYLYVGRITKEKGVEKFCEIITKANLKGLVVGDGSEKKVLESRYPNIKFVGWKSEEEVKKYISSSRGLIFPSLWYEGAPLTPLEFMSMGLPCAISNLCAGKEYIQNNNGVLIDPYNIEDSVNQVKILNENRIEMGNRAFEFYKEFTSKNYVDEVINVYKEMSE